MVNVVRFVISKGKLVASDTTENLEKQFAGGNQLEVTIKGEEQKAKEIVSAIKGVESVRVLDRKEANTCCLQVNVKKKREIREELFYALAEAKMPIYDLRAGSKSLEDIFLSLTGEKKSEAEKIELQKTIDVMEEKTEGSEEE